MDPLQNTAKPISGAGGASPMTFLRKDKVNAEVEEERPKIEWETAEGTPKGREGGEGGTPWRS